MDASADDPFRALAPEKAARADINAIEAVLDIHQLDIGSYPITQQGLQALRVAPSDLPDPSKWQRPNKKKGNPG
jgi:general secretion pathway protein G